MAPNRGGGIDKDAKHALDRIGAEVHDIAHKEAQSRSYNELQGKLSKVLFSDNTQNTETDPCKLDYNVHTNVTSGQGRENPCYGRVQDRFSDERRSQCTSNRIRGSVNDDVGACAPYRRLHVCDENLEVIDPKKITSTNNLLMDVLLAAKYEGKSLMEKYPHNEHHNKEGICTALARSFADIGDIIRGKDLYRGNSKEKDNLQNKLKEYFDKIYNSLTDHEREHYKKDNDQNLYKLREDWWNANRKEVWRSITCKASDKAFYFRPTCGRNGSTNTQCRCVSGDVPTYFDYVPQYLRWFEEWSEDFCRKKNFKLQNAITNCREGENENGEPKYCSRNGYDCTKTIRSIDQYSMSRECAKCLYVCDPYVKWIDNKKKEFEKQKEKCEIEIYDDAATSPSSPKVYNNMYETHFYEHLKKDYQSMNDFLKLLNNETPCTNIIDEKNKIDFTKDPDDIFSHTEYCEPCPWCGIKKEKGTWKKIEENDSNCPKKPPYTPPPGVEPTEINVLQKDKNGKDIVQMLQNFCNNKDNESGIKKEQWKCYYETDKNKCVLENGEKLGGERKVKDYDNFLMFWVTHMLKDSIEWRSKLSKCLKNDKKTCIRKCNDNCKCYEKWVKQKEKEWKQIKTHFDKQTDVKQFGNYFVLESVLEGDQFLTDITKAYGDSKEIRHIQQMMEKKKQQDHHKDASKTKTIIDELLDHELKEANDCTVTHKNDCPDEDSEDEDEDDYEDIPQRQNPCATASGSTYPVLANKVAYQMHKKVHMEAKSRSGGKNLLKANAKEGTYRKKGVGKNLDATFCNIDTTYSNSTDRSNDPCQDKDKEQKRFKVGTEWKDKDFVNPKYPGIYMPPRRQHICTSNLEFLQTDYSPLNGKGNGGDKVNHSFLGDVLLSAKIDAERIKKLYKEHNSIRELNDTKDKETICRAVRYSFADIGDIIKGTDMWDHEDFNKIEGYLVKIFEKIKTQLPKEIQGKYKDMSPYLDLRKDWWEANRRQVWRAMQCALKDLKKSDGDCAYSRGTYPPVDDYIPQRLRWMTEWVEWYCKMQSQEYEKLLSDCNQCKDGGKECRNGDHDCNKCTPACTAYRNKIKEWEKQWNNMQVQYLLLYKNAETTAGHGGTGKYVGDVEPKDKPVAAFLQELQKVIKSSTSKRPKRSIPRDTTSPYSTAAGYIHQEVPNVGCMKQEVFCEKTGDKKNNNYAFKDSPPDYEQACECKDREAPKKPEVPKKPNVCDTVKTLLNAHAGQDKIDSCNEKNDRTWNCSVDNFNEHNKGACMPPRRISLCLHYLEHGINGSKSLDDLRDAFIKTAAAETFLSWNYYKGKNSVHPKQLESGIIPPEFLRSMFYTFGDYRDLCLYTDISKLNTHTKAVKTNIDRIFPPTEPTNDTIRKEFWDDNGKHIWEAMLCVLENFGADKETLIKNYDYETVKFTQPSGATLPTFAKTPQFLRWITEWGEEFCKKRKEKVDKLAKDCEGCIVGKCGSECDECKKQCEQYQKWLKTWQEHYEQQKIKYKNDKDSYTNDSDVMNSTEAYQYLDKKLENIKCTSGNTNVDCNCMHAVSKQASNEGSIIETMPESLDNEPKEVIGKCDCKEESQLPMIPIVPAVQDDVCKIVDAILEEKEGNHYKEACNLKYEGKKEKHTQWKCTTNKTKNGGKDDVVCIPPRRQKLYLKNLENLNEKSENDLRRVFIQCAAIETVFAWHKYKEDKKNETKKEEISYVGVYISPVNEGEPSQDVEAQNQLYSGIIQDDFKRQMFYTYADYRDIFFGKDIGSDMSEVNQKITSVFSNSSQNNDRQRKEFWEKNGPAIWEGMICALSHASGNKENVQKTLIKEYDYKNVKFDSKNGPSNGISLSDFATVPYFIRWFEEWSEEFCRKRKIILEKVKEECRSDKPGRTYCSGDGEDCENILKQNFNNVSDFYCPSCKNQCTHYKKWMNTKKNEFNKQTEKYKKEIDNVENNNYDNYDENFVQTLSKNYKSINIFLKNLKNGPYCNNNNVDGIIDFNNPDDTFSSSKYCVSCPVFGVKCIGNNCIEVTKDKYSKFKGIVSENIKNKGPNNIGILITDNSIKDISKELENFCKDTGIFEGIRKDEWTCDYVYDLDVCNLSNKNNKKHNNKPISIRILFKRWLEYFLKDYSKLKKKLNSCTNNAEQSICINECQNRCVCAEKWVNQKMEEWKIVRERFINQYNVGKLEEVYQVNSVLSQSVYPSDIQNALDESDTLEQLKESGGCPISARSDKTQCEKKDVITILLNKLQENIKSCKDKHDKKTHSNCSEKLPPDAEPQSTSETPTNETYDEYEVEDPSSASTSISSRPDFCPEIPQPEPEPEPLPEEEKLPAAPDNSEQEETSKEVVPEKKVPTPPSKKPEQGPKQRKKQKRQLPSHTSILPEMLSISSFPLTVGLAFAALSYFLLKKKSKSTIDLLRVIDIPKGEYGIPTLKSKNRYIPYASDRYKGKTYIYMEGDESDNYTYIGDISSSDITSSESEYEDIDINNIYPYKSPKYKTLIDVVLEPSKRDTFNTQSDIPSDTSTNKFTDNEWNKLKQDFISNILQSTQMDLPNENIIDDFMDKGIQPNNPVLDVNMPEKPFITSIHDRDLHNGEEVTYNINFDVSKNINEITNTTDDSKYVSNNIYSGIDLINDSLNSDQHVDIYDELLKRKENEIFGTNHTKHTTINSIAKQTHTDPILSQLDLFHKWLDRHRNMCEQWNKNKKEELLDKLKEEWNKKNNNNSDLTHTSSNIPSGENSIKNVLNTDVSIQIDMDDPKPINEFTNMDNIIDNLEKNSEPYYDIDEDDIIYFDIDDEKTPMDHNNMDNNKSNVPTKVQIEMNVINKQELFQEEFPISDIWNI
ncbi:erythrocyte membrane protein 1, PfEMP1 [Plasmodium sp. gorilla clade G1]|nr:erythrocyte membrane protein 1, PfEMP1 [Plasmodium sp. gorilla clade G1]